jgi:hypothetical protein
MAAADKGYLGITDWASTHAQLKSWCEYHGLHETLTIAGLAQVSEPFLVVESAALPDCWEHASARIRTMLLNIAS